MELYLKATAIVLVALLLILIVNHTNHIFGTILSLTVCVMIAGICLGYLKPILDFCRKLNDLGKLRTDMLQILLKTVGIAITSDVAVTICEDAGNKSLGKALQLLSSAIILYLSLPLLTALLDIIEEILSNI